MSTSAENRSHFEHDSMPPPPVTAAGGNGGGGDDSAAAPAQTTSADHASVSSGNDHVVEKTAPAEKLNKRQKVKRHCARFWLWWLIGTIIFLAIILPIAFKVILPKIVQNIVNGQELPVLGGALLAVSPTELKMALDTSLDTPLGASLDAFPLYLFNRDTDPYSPFTNLTMPEQYVKHYTAINITEQAVPVTNLTEMIKFFDRVFDQVDVEVGVIGDTTVHLGAIKAPAHIDKTVNVKALNKFEGFSILDLQLLAPPDAQGNNLKSTINLPNHGILTLGLGDLGLNLLSGDIVIGSVTCPGVLLQPGDNSVECTGQLLYSVVFGSLSQIMATQRQALLNGDLEIGAHGNTSMINGEHIPYIEEVLKKKILRTRVPLAQLLSDVVGGFVGGDLNLSSVAPDALNSTLLQTMINHWTAYDNAGNATTNNSPMAARKRDAAEKKRVATRENDIVQRNMMWAMLKMGMAMSKR